MTETEDPSEPPAHDAAPPTSTADDEDVHQEDDDEQVLSAETLPEGVEYMGDAPDLSTHFRRELEELMDPAILWLLECVDWRQVKEKMEGDRYRYCCAGGCVYRIEVASW